MLASQLPWEQCLFYKKERQNHEIHVLLSRTALGSFLRMVSWEVNFWELAHQKMSSISPLTWWIVGLATKFGDIKLVSLRMLKALLPCCLIGSVVLEKSFCFFIPFWRWWCHHLLLTSLLSLFVSGVLKFHSDISQERSIFISFGEEGR